MKDASQQANKTSTNPVNNANCLEIRAKSIRSSVACATNTDDMQLKCRTQEKEKKLQRQVRFNHDIPWQPCKYQGHHLKAIGVRTPVQSQGRAWPASFARTKLRDNPLGIYEKHLMKKKVTTIEKFKLFILKDQDPS